MEIKIPGSKSITNRVLLLDALARGKSTLRNVLESEDTKIMRQCLRNIGHGKVKLYCGNAGTAMRFLTAHLATRTESYELSGNARMHKRPIRDLVDALTELGANIEYRKKFGFPPLFVRGPLRGGTCTLKGETSSQYLSGLLMAAPFAQRDVKIEMKGRLVSAPYIDMTIALMRQFCVSVIRNGYREFRVKAGQKYRAARLCIEPDASSASYFWGLGALTQTPITIDNLDPVMSIQPDARFAKILTQLTRDKESGFFESFGTVDCEKFPDSAMTLIALSAFARGTNRFTGLANLRVKECDRVHALATELRKLGCTVTERADGLTVTGQPKRLDSARQIRISTYHDHRMAMCFGMLQSVLPNLHIENPQCVAKTFPTFWKLLKKARGTVSSRCIVLTGMRCSGKTFLGKKLAQKLKRKFIDLDQQIEKNAGRSIKEIVEKRGWQHFRMLEQRALKSLEKRKNLVLATGGGIVISHTNVAILKKMGVIIFLQASSEQLKKRMTGSFHRPALSRMGSAESELASIYRKRLPLYRATADAIIDISSDSPDLSLDLRQKVAIVRARCQLLGICLFL